MEISVPRSFDIHLPANASAPISVRNCAKTENAAIIMHISAIDLPALITDLVSISADRLKPLRGIPRLSERLSFGIRSRASMRFAAVFETRITAPAVGEEYSRPEIQPKINAGPAP